MSSSVLQLLVLAGIAIFLIVRLKGVLGTRDGFEKPPAPLNAPTRQAEKPQLEVIDGGPDRDIIDHVPAESELADALAAMKKADRSFNVSEFLGGARAAYEMILMSFENGKLDEIRAFLDQEVYESFQQGIAMREERGLSIESEFLGVREMSISDAAYDPASATAEITIRFVGELTTVVRDRAGEIVEGDARSAKKQKDIWTFARDMGSSDPNWKLVATDA